MLTYKAWHDYIQNNRHVLEVKEIPVNAHKYFISNTNELGIEMGTDNYILEGEIYHPYEFKQEEFVIIKWDKYILESVLNGECEYFQADALQNFKEIYFKAKFEETVNES